MWVKYWLVDVFSEKPLSGNAAAVVFEADGIDSATMQSIARELNVSETVYLLKPVQPHADYRVRIFTPRTELPFAGHPTIAAAFAISRGREEKSAAETALLLKQECAIGLVSVRVERQGAAPIIHVRQVMRELSSLPILREQWAATLGIAREDIEESPGEMISTGVRWAVVQVRTPSVVGRIKPDLRCIEEWSRNFGYDGVTVFAIDTENSDRIVRVRTFAPIQGIDEDPVCGSGNGSVGAFIARHRLMPGPSFSYLVHQGAEVDRHGFVHVKVECTAGGITVDVGGAAVVAAVGKVWAGEPNERAE